MEGILRGLALVVLGLCGWHVTVRSPQWDSIDPPVISVPTLRSTQLVQPLPGELYRAAVTTRTASAYGDSARAVLPPPPAGCVWRVAITGPGDSTDRSRVTVTPANGSPPQGAGLFVAHRMSPIHRVSRPIGRQDAHTVPAFADVAIHESSPRREGPEVDLLVHETAPDDARGYIAVKTYVAAESRLVRVLVDRQLSADDLAPGLVAALVADWTNDVQPTLSRQFETPVLTGRVDLVISPLLSRFRGAVALDGMVRPDDLRTDQVRPFSAGREVVYLNSRLRPGDALRTVLAHEATHLACLQVRRAALAGSIGATRGATSGRTAGAITQVPWLTEGLAHCGERLVAPGWSNLQTRLKDWSENTAIAPVWLDAEASPDRWRDPASRAAAFLFTDWLGRRYGPGFCEAVCRSPSDGTDALEPLLGEPATDLLEEFAVACLLSDHPELLTEIGGVPIVDLPAGMRPQRQQVTGREGLELQGSALLLLEPTGQSAGWQIDLVAPVGAAAAVLAIAVPERASGAAAASERR
jgi:hypothetical protein